jgi:hypothetical protein
VKQRAKKWMAVVLSAQTLAAGGTLAAVIVQPAPAAVQAARPVAAKPLSVKPGEIQGAIFDPVTTKPWGQVTIELVDGESGKVLATATTDAKGGYRFADVKEGKYVVRVNGKLALAVEVSPAAEADVLNLAVPTAVMGQAAGVVTWTAVAVVGAGVVTAVAAPAVVGLGGGGGGGGHRAVSPS